MELFKTVFLMVALMLVFIFVGNALGGSGGMVVAFLMACGMNFFAYFFSSSLVLKHYHAEPLNSSHRLYKLLSKLTTSANLPMPQLYLINDQAPNAFATGRNHSNAVVAVTSGLVESMNDEQIAAVIAHELGHIRHYDILTGSIAAVFAGGISMLANIFQFGALFSNNQQRGNLLFNIALVVVMPIVATVIQLGISRSREYAADEFAARLTNPLWLKSALLTLQNASGRGVKDADEASAHLFITSPFSSKSTFASLFSTHPSIQNRIQRLEILAKEGVKGSFSASFMTNPYNFSPKSHSQITKNKPSSEPKKPSRTAKEYFNK